MIRTLKSCSLVVAVASVAGDLRNHHYSPLDIVAVSGGNYSGEYLALSLPAAAR